MTLRGIEDLDVSAKRVLVRVDFNVPLDGKVIADDTRIRAALPTIQKLIERQAKVILCSHLGRPNGRIDPDLSLKPVAECLNGLIESSVMFAGDTIGDAARETIAGMSSGEVVVLENVRFEPGEEANDPEFARQLAALADCYVNDAFGAVHRAHASTVGVVPLLPSAAGYLMLSEIQALTKVLNDAEPPLVLILGGAKISDKIGVIESFLERAQAILIGGGMANTFLLANGHEVGKSLAEAELIDTARNLIQRAMDRKVDLVLPEDCAVAPSLDDASEHQTLKISQMASELAIFDIGPSTVDQFKGYIEQAGTVVWNGPMGVFEVPPFERGTLEVARSVGAVDGYSLVGGGDSVAALASMDLLDRIDHVSTGGGASLEYLEGKPLPGIKVLEDCE